MAKKIILIVGVAVGVAALVALAWWWFLKQPQAQQPAHTGGFGSAQNKTLSGVSPAGTNPTNLGTSIPQEQGTQQPTNVPLTGSGAYPQDLNSAGAAANTAPAGPPQGQLGVAGVTWFAGTAPITGGGVITNGASIVGGSVIGGGTTGQTGTIIQQPGGGTGGSNPTLGGSGTVFTPTPINQIDSSNPTGGVSPAFGGGSGGGSSGGGSAIAGLLAGAAAGVGICAANFLIGAALGGGLGAGAGGAVALATTPIVVQTNSASEDTYLTALNISTGINTGLHTSDTTRDDVLNCIVRGVARITLQQITNSVVNWINNGFNGSPSFVTNPTQFFGNVADQAAGYYLQGSALSFLCSPFQLQVKIAIAQSYAQRYDNQYCSLTGAVSNINNFLRGDFNAGGWGGLITMTTMPANNPYGAFVYGSIGLSGAISSAQGQKQAELSQGMGFLTFQKESNCHPVADQNASYKEGQQNLDATPDGKGGYTYRVCDLVNTTPGSVIAASINKSLGMSQDELNLAKNFDEIISALITQLMTRALQGGLSNLSGDSGNYASNFYTPDQLQAQQQSQGLLTRLQNSVLLAQQYGSVEQGIAQDSENAQLSVHSLIDCWNGAAAATTGAKAQTALANAQAASTTLETLQAQVNTANNEVVRANSAIAALNQLQNRALSAASSADINSVDSDFTAAANSGQIFSQSDIITAQQNRTTVQAGLATISQQMSAGLQQCNAYH